MPLTPRSGSVQQPIAPKIPHETHFLTILFVVDTRFALIANLDSRTIPNRVRLTIPIGRYATSKAADQERRTAMMQNWKRCLVGGIALTAAIALGSTMATTPAHADHDWSWEGAVIGGVIGGLLGSTTGKRSKHRDGVRVGVTLGNPYDGPFIVHQHHGAWHQHQGHHRRGWIVWLDRQGPMHVHPQRHHRRQWHAPRVHPQPWQAHPPRQQYRQWHGPQVQLQPRYVHPQKHRQRHWHKERAHVQPRYVHPERHRHGHKHRW